MTCLGGLIASQNNTTKLVKSTKYAAKRSSSCVKVSNVIIWSNNFIMKWIIQVCCLKISFKYWSSDHGLKSIGYKQTNTCEEIKL